MKPHPDQFEMKKQVEMYLDQALDPKTQNEFLQKLDTDPQYQKVYQNELAIRDNIKKFIYRPGDSSQLVRAIKNQIHNRD